MRVLIVYESLLGNTRLIAEAVARGAVAAASDADVQCLPAARLSDEVPEADLVVVGGPTHHFGLPAERTRRIWLRGALRRGRSGGHGMWLEPGGGGPGLREWFAAMDADGSGEADCLAGARRRGCGPRAAAFDTRLDRPMAGSAARGIAHRLRRHGFDVVARPQGFLVAEPGGPLRAGELDRAAAWGADLVARTPRPAH